MQLSTNKSLAPTTLSEAIQFSELLASSTMIPKQFQGKPQDVLVCVQWGFEIGLAPLQALQNIAVVNGKPSIYGDAAMALVQASSVCEDIEEFFEGEGTTNPIAVCIARRKGRKPVTYRFGIDDAKRAGLWGKQGPWVMYPKRMMQMRARGFALRDAFPDVLRGLITSEEAQDFVENEKAAPVAKPSNPLDLIAPPVVEIDDAIEPVEVEATPELATTAFPLFVPNKAEPHSYFETLEAWQDGYEAIADRTASAGKVPARERMTILRELKEANEPRLKSIDTVVRARHTMAYQKRIKSLGAAI
jgi:hypothetical protein